MSRRDKFKAELRCPECGREGVAHLSELDGYAYMRGDKSTHVDSLTDGFVQVEAPSWIRNDLDFQCADHAVSAMVKKRPDAPR
jgi:hypothetical protein